MRKGRRNPVLSWRLAVSYGGEIGPVLSCPCGCARGSIASCEWRRRNLLDRCSALFGALSIGPRRDGLADLGRGVPVAGPAPRRRIWLFPITRVPCAWQGGSVALGLRVSMIAPSVPTPALFSTPTIPDWWEMGRVVSLFGLFCQGGVRRRRIWGGFGPRDQPEGRRWKCLRRAWANAGRRG